MTVKLYSLFDKFRNTNQKRMPPKILRRLVGVILLMTMMIVFSMKKENQMMMREMMKTVMDLAVSPVMKIQEQNLSQ